MSRPRDLVFALLFPLILTGAVAAQDTANTAAQKPSSLTITAAASGDRVRIAAPSSIVQMHVEVFAPSGEKLFDQENRGGNVFDWHLQNGQAERVASGDYLCVVTVKNIAGKLTQRIGAVRVGEKDVSVAPAESGQLSPQQSQAIGPVEENSSWTILIEDQNQTTTVIAHDGSDGQVTRGRGALSFRLGDFFSGNDKEQMRLTEEGNLGIGTAKPRVKLDVAGTVRAQQGFMFNDGSTLNVNEKGALILTASDGTVAPNTAGTGTQNHLAKWLETGGAGTLGDSGVTELANGFVGIGTTNPQVRLDVVDDTSGVGGFQLTNHTNGSTAQLQNRLINNAGAFAYYGITSTSYTQAPILSNRAFFGSFQADTVIWTQTANDILFATNGLSTATERMRIKSSGNVGIGTSAPLSRLQVVTTNDTAPGNITGWDSRHFVIGGTASGGGIGMSYDQTNNVGYIEALSPSVAWRNLVIQSGGGNVGIGTAAPTARLAVRGNGTDVLLGDVGCGSPTAAIGFGSLSGCVNFALGANPNLNETVINRPAGGQISFREGNGADQMTINSGGNVGIGTPAPAARLQIINSSPDGSNNTAAFSAPNLGPNFSHIHFGTTGDWYIRSAANTGKVILQDSGGNVGVGTTNPQARLHAVGANGGIGVLGEVTGVDGVAGDFRNNGNTAAIAIRANGNAVQNREFGGWVKAMAYIDPATAAGPTGGIVRCYNSQASGITRTVPKCGFTFTYEALGIYNIDFGFDVSDRFILANALFGSAVTNPYIISGTKVYLYVRYTCCGSQVGDTTDAPFFIFVY